MSSKLLSQTYQVDQVPEHFKEPFIISGYRHPRSSFLQCVASIFCANNETFNFWTHFVPACFFCYRTYHFLSVHDLGDAYCLPMLTYLITLCLFPFTSAVAHVFNPLSDRARHVCFFLDYWALSQYSVGAAVAYRAYIFPNELLGGTFHRVYLYMAIVCGMVSLIVSCQSRFMAHGLKKKVLRSFAYAIPYSYDSIPSIYRLCYCRPEECTAPALVPHCQQFFYAGLSALLYLSHWPERSFQGKFDILGHSHQLFHIFSVYASYLQMTGLTLDFEDRKDYLHLHNDFLSSAWSVSLFLLLGSVNLMILLYFVYKLVWVQQGSNSWQNLYSRKLSSQNGYQNGDSSYRHVDLDENVNNWKQSLESPGSADGDFCRSDDIASNGMKKGN